MEDVVEFFTSQGCPSCPPADAILAKLAEEPGVLALAYHVDYWDYIGWRDRFGSPENTKRQRDYARALQQSSIYTPQAVVNGRASAIGSHESSVRELMDQTQLPKAKSPAELKITRAGRYLHIVAEPTGNGRGSAEPGSPPVLMLVVFDDLSSTLVERGENAGHELVNVHSVTGWRVLGTWTGRTMSVDIPISMLARPDDGRFGCAAIMQSITPDGAPGPILAAAQIEIEPQ